jgi:hypothetical protein
VIDLPEFDRDKSLAISSQAKKLASRSETQSHRSFIRNAVKTRADDEEFLSLIRAVFAHHDTGSFSFLPFQSVDIDNPEHISRFFHHQNGYYLPPDIVQGQYVGNPKLNYQEFLNTVLPKSKTSKQNHLTFLIGGVGIGKTTFLCNFICRSLTMLEKNDFVPIKINIDVSTAHSIPSRVDILRIAKAGVLSGLRSNGILTDSEVERLSADCRVTGELDESTADINFAHLIGLIQNRYKKRILLIIDNIDFLYHLGDRGFFAKEGDAHPDRAPVRGAHAAIVEIIKMFWLQSERMSSMLGMPIVVACRQDTIAFLLSQHHEVPLNRIEERLYSLSPPDLDRALAVVSARFSLLERLVAKIDLPAKRNEMLAMTRKLRDLYINRRKPGDALLDDLWRLSRKGLRDMIHQISEYSWLEFLDERKVSLTARFTQQYYPSMLAYMLSGRRRYTQFFANVPNIYLVNAPSPSNEVGVPKEFKLPHLHTIWLKRLILAYLVQRKKNGLNTNENNIIDTFCGRNRRGYSEQLVRYVLSSLLEVPTSELIEVDVGAEGSAGAVGYVKQIDITARGEFLLDQCADSFKYLQLVVDDWKMLLPISLLGLFSYVDPDYSYLVEDEATYGDALDKILVRKGRQAFYFAVLIEEALVFESRTWPKVFARLKEAGVVPLGAVRPTEQLRREIGAIKSALRLDISLDYMDTTNERQARAVIFAALSELYEPCKEFRTKHYGFW